jgi:hypothetical protein
MPTGGADQAIGDLGRLQGTDPAVQRRNEIRREIDKQYFDPTDPQGDIGVAAMREAAVKVAAAREAAKDGRITELEAENEQLHANTIKFREESGEYHSRLAKAQRLIDAVSRGWADARELGIIRAALEGTTDPEVPGE